MQPHIVGLPARSRRGTPGLRREEVAALAGVSISWYTRLEQGNPIGISAEVVESLARVFRMSAAETTYFHLLAREQLPVQQPPLIYSVEPHIQQILDGFTLYPACVINPFWDVIAWNAAFCRVFGDYALRTGRERNSLWRMFTDPTWRTLIENWHIEAPKFAAIFRYATQSYGDESWFRAFIDDLRLCAPEFESWWQAQEVSFRHDERKVIAHPVVGRLALLPTTLEIVAADHLRIVVDVPLSEYNTADKLAALVAGQERSVPVID
ncbi:MAG: helix-turn-helix transcriptional regulator [Chloroflexota bacterium]|nr:helix-turn-helix transcriptional regulator [Chloroflexota bacterium]